MFDIVIIGAGTAGLSAAIYASRTGKSALVLEGKAYGGQIINTPDIENYPGIAHISGFDFATGLYNQAKALGAVVKMQQALRITKADGRFLVDLNYTTRVVAIADPVIESFPLIGDNLRADELLLRLPESIGNADIFQLDHADSCLSAPGMILREVSASFYHNRRPGRTLSFF